MKGHWSCGRSGFRHPQGQEPPTAWNGHSTPTPERKEVAKTDLRANTHPASLGGWGKLVGIGGASWREVTIDRLLMVLLNQPSIREIIVFPENKEARDLLMDAPAESVSYS